MSEERKLARGVRHLPDQKVRDIVEAGRTFEEIVADIRQEGVVFTPRVLRNSIIGGLEIRPKKRTAENAIIIGCACFGTALPLRSFCLLLQHLGIDYVFLEKEYCCGAPLLNKVLLDGEDRTAADELGKEFSGLNIALCRARGAQNIVYFCPWCAYTARRAFPDEQNLLFYPQILTKHLDSARLRLCGRVGYFGGSPHRKAVYVPEGNFDLDWDDFRAMLDKVDGLEVVRIPRYCCQLRADLMFDSAKAQGLDTIVVSCVVCYGKLMRVAPAGIKVRYITDLLLEAAGARVC